MTGPLETVSDAANRSAINVENRSATKPLKRVVKSMTGLLKENRWSSP